MVGLKWLNDQLQKPGCSCLYLTMSENLVYTLDYEFRRGRDGRAIRSEAEISTTFDFLRRYLKVFYPDIPERSLLPEYGAVFLDECQDLTQMELLAIFHLLQKSLTKRMASDRCQMVQPTYFNEGWMRTASNDYDRFLGKDIDLYGCKARFLHYNYRSSRSIIDFQNYIIQYFMESDIMTLKQNETAEIKVPPLTPDGVMPVWIRPGAGNKQLLIDELCSKLDASVLQTIFAFDNSVGKEDFPDADTAAVTDVISCKGMEYPSVLLYNLLTETRFDPVLAWKYFYVGATRGNRCIIIYEDAAADGSRITGC